MIWLICRLPSLFRWMPWIVNGVLADARGRLAVVLLRQGGRDPVAELLLERAQPLLPRVGLVVAEEREDDVHPRVRPVEAIVFVAAYRRRLSPEPLVRRAEVFRTQPRGEVVAAEPEIADDQLVLRKSRLQHRLQPAVVLHPLRQGIADDPDVILLAKLKRRGGRARRGDRRDDRETRRQSRQPPAGVRPCSAPRYRERS